MIFKGNHSGKTDNRIAMYFDQLQQYHTTLMDIRVKKNLVYARLRMYVIYENARFYCAFPSVVKRPNGELDSCFPQGSRQEDASAKKKYTHTDPNSYLVLVRSQDGDTWTKEPELIYAHAFGGSQDPCLLQLRDKTLLCTSYGWTIVKSEGKFQILKNL